MSQKNYDPLVIQTVDRWVKILNYIGNHIVYKLLMTVECRLYTVPVYFYDPMFLIEN